MMPSAHPLVHLNALLNTVATVLLWHGLRRIRQGRETAHGKTMLGALAVSTLFLISYVTYHTSVRGSVPFTHGGAVRYVYYCILVSHIVLAVTVPFLAIWAAWLGIEAIGWRRKPVADDLRQRSRSRHRRLVRWAFPIWLYVSITGVTVYLMLYHIWPSEALSG